MGEVLTVRETLHLLLDIAQTQFDGTPQADAVLQITTDGENFYAIEEFEDYGDGGVIARIVPWPPDGWTQECEAAGTRAPRQDGPQGSDG